MVKEMFKYIVGIILSILAIIISIPIWEYSFSSDYLAIVNEYKDNEFLIDYEDPDIKIIKEEDLVSIHPSTINIKNVNKYDGVGTLYFVLSTNIDIDYINIMFEDKSYKLSSLESYKINEYEYFKLKDVAIKEYKEDTYTYKIWIDNGYLLDDDDTLTIDFQVKTT